MRVISIQVPAETPAKEWVFIPALALLGVIIWLQRGRLQRRQTAAAAGTPSA
jgi:hypothetical protein